MLATLACALVACNAETKTVRLPLYEKCVPGVDAYLKQQQKAGVDLVFHIVKFDYLPRAHAFIDAYLEISFGTIESGTQKYINNVKAMCFPQHSLSVKGSSKGLKQIKKQLAHNQKLGIDSSYFAIQDDKLILYFNAYDKKQPWIGKQGTKPEEKHQNKK